MNSIQRRRSGSECGRVGKFVEGAWKCGESISLSVGKISKLTSKKKSFSFKHILLHLNLMISLIFLAFMLKLKLFLIVLPTCVRTPAQVRPYPTNDPPSIRLVIQIGYKLSVKCKDSVIFFIYEPLCPKGELLCSISISWNFQVQPCASHVSY